METQHISIKMIKIITLTTFSFLQKKIVLVSKKKGKQNGHMLDSTIQASPCTASILLLVPGWDSESYLLSHENCAS